MTPLPSADFSPGDACPDPVARLVAFGFYDGATDGVLETRAGRSYRFDFIDEWPGATADSVRMFLLSPLPVGAFVRLVGLISPHCDFREPFWIPSWWHLPADAKAALDREVDAILDSAGPPEWAVAGWFLCGRTLRVRAVALTAEELAGLRNDPDRWAAAFGLSARPGG